MGGTRKYTCDKCGIQVEHGSDDASKCKVLEKRYGTGEGISDWAKMWGSVHCCLCLKTKDAWSDVYFKHRGCQQCQDRMPPPPEEVEDEGG